MSLFFSRRMMEQMGLEQMMEKEEAVPSPTRLEDTVLDLRVNK